MKPDIHSELEHKFAADHVAYDKFIAWAMGLKPYRYNSRSCPDLYYEQGPNTVRHRWSGGGGELTVKLRKHDDSITDRVEVDLKFPVDTSINDVTAFLNASGWKRAFTLFKDEVHCFWYEVPGGEISLSIYGVEKLDEDTQMCVDPRRFIEVEVEKSSQMTPHQVAAVLGKWRRTLCRKFRLGAPLNTSLYEMYSGRNYRTAEQRTENGHGTTQGNHRRRTVRLRRHKRAGRRRDR